MDGNSLGKKLKEARIARKMTQSEVVGDFITRNMLSQIESGNAYPSMKTLEYLAHTLNIPMSSLMPDYTPTEQSAKAENSVLDILIKAKQLFKNERYRDCIDMLSPTADTPSDISDEISAILSRAYIRLAKGEKHIQTAVEYAKKAQKYAGNGIYESREIRTEAVLLLDGLAEKISPSLGRGEF